MSTLFGGEHNNLISNSQFGFKIKRSYVDNLILLISETEKQFYKKNHFAAVFLDIKEGL